MRLMRNRFRGICLPVVAVAVIMLLLAGCADHESLTTDTRSTYFETAEEKLAFLETYLKLPSEVADAEYHIMYHDNSGGLVPGPSDWEIRAAIKVAEADVSLWSDEMKRVLPEQIDLAWWEDLRSEALTWTADEVTECYRRPGTRTYVAVLSDRNIILKLVTTMYQPVAVDLAVEDAVQGYETYKNIVADHLGYDDSAAPYIKAVQAEKVRTADGTEAEIISFSAKYLGSPVDGIPVLAISRDGNVICETLADGFDEGQFSLADIDGDGYEEVLTYQKGGITGGDGSQLISAYKIADSGLETILYHPDREGD